MTRRRLLIALVTVAALAALALPPTLAFGLGWMELGWDPDKGLTGGLRDPNPIEAWVVLALAWFVWTVAVAVVMVWLFDRIGYHYLPVERTPRASRRATRRRVALLRLHEAEQGPPPRRRRPRDGG